MFDFNLYSSLLLPGFLVGTVHAGLLALRSVREERLADLFASFILLIGSLYVAQWMLGFAGWYDSHDARTTLMFYLPWQNLAALGPLVWLYFRAVTNTDFVWRGHYWWHFALFGLTLIQPVFNLIYDFGWHRLLQGNDFLGFNGTRGPAAEWENSDNWYPTVPIIVVVRLVVIAYLVQTIREFRRYQHYLDEQFSNARRLTLPGLRVLLWILLLGIGSNFLLEVSHYIWPAQTYMDSWNRFLVMAVLIFFAGIQFYAISPELTRPLRFAPETETRVPKSTVHPPVESPSGIDAEVRRWSERLDERLAQHEDYLDPELKLADLAERIGTNSSVLSKVINTVHEKNFNDFVNALRCAAFLKRVERGDHRRHTLLSLAIDCGFNSKSTFNRAFRKRYSTSPGAYIRKIEPENA